MVYMAGADHLPVKFSPLRHDIGPRPPEPPTPTANFLTPGRTMTQSALASTLVGTSLPAIIACKTADALRMVCSSSALVAPHTGRVVRIRNRAASNHGTARLVLSISTSPSVI